MRGRLWIAVLITIILGSGFPIGSYAREDSYRIMKLVRLRDGKAESVTRDSENLVEIRDSMGRDRTPEEGVKEGDEITLGRYVHCGPGIGVALQASNDRAFWINSDTIVQVKDKYIRADRGEIYSRAKRLKLELTDGTVIDPRGSEFYLRAAKEESLLYLFKGEINLGSYVLNKQKSFTRISAGEIEYLGSDKLPENIEERVKMWRKSIRRVTAPLWRKPKFYVPTAAVTAMGIVTAVYYLIRKPEPGVRIRIEIPSSSLVK